MQKKTEIENNSIRWHRIFKSVLGTGLIILILSACSTSKPIKKFPVSLGAGTLLILPFKNMSSVYGVNKNVRSPLSGSFFTTGDVSSEAEHSMTKSVSALLQKCTQYTFISGGKARSVIAGTFAENKNPVEMRKHLARVGQQLGADWVVAGGIYRFKERIGGTMSVEAPASAAFDIALIDVNNPRLLWTGHFDETQKPLSENILNFGSFVKRQGKWVSADELTRLAMEEMFKTCVKK
jgi:TolB-like protein